MNAKGALIAGLLLLVGAAVGTAVVRIAGEKSSEPVAGNPADAPGQPAREARSSEANGAKSASENLPQALDDGVIVYLCHGNVRCPTCVAIQKATEGVLDAEFAEPIGSGRIVVKEINYEKPANKGYVTKYQLIAPTVVLVRIEDGEEVSYKNLMEVWQLIGEQEEFHAFMTEQIETMLEGVSA